MRINAIICALLGFLMVEGCQLSRKSSLSGEAVSPEVRFAKLSIVSPSQKIIYKNTVLKPGDKCTDGTVGARRLVLNQALTSGVQKVQDTLPQLLAALPLETRMTKFGQLVPDHSHMNYLIKLETLEITDDVSYSLSGERIYEPQFLKLIFEVYDLASKMIVAKPEVKMELNATIRAERFAEMIKLSLGLSKDYLSNTTLIKQMSLRPAPVGH